MYCVYKYTLHPIEGMKTQTMCVCCSHRLSQSVLTGCLIGKSHPSSRICDCYKEWKCWPSSADSIPSNRDDGYRNNNVEAWSYTDDRILYPPCCTVHNLPRTRTVHIRFACIALLPFPAGKDIILPNKSVPKLVMMQKSSVPLGRPTRCRGNRNLFTFDGTLDGAPKLKAWNNSETWTAIDNRFPDWTLLLWAWLLSNNLLMFISAYAWIRQFPQQLANYSPPLLITILFSIGVRSL